jgi:hypothetical protein
VQSSRAVLKLSTSVNPLQGRSDRIAIDIGQAQLQAQRIEKSPVGGHKSLFRDGLDGRRGIPRSGNRLHGAAAVAERTGSEVSRAQISAGIHRQAAKLDRPRTRGFPIAQIASPHLSNPLRQSFRPNVIALRQQTVVEKTNEPRPNLPEESSDNASSGRQ